MKKVLFTATVDSHILHFHIPYLKLFKSKGYEVHVATNGDDEIPYCDVKHKVCFERSPFKIKNLKAIKELKEIIKKEKFDIIHTHTPMGSVVTRLAAKNSRKNNGTRVIYTAHGFHFYKGASFINWLMFYPVEKILSFITDDIITINDEDYKLAKKRFNSANIYYVPGVGVSCDKFKFDMSDKEKKLFRESIGLKKDDFVIICVAELNKNKNQKMIINVVRKLVSKYSNVKVLFVGQDSFSGKYQELVKKYNLSNNIKFLGYRKDIPSLMKISDLAVSSSKREGLPVNIIEACFSLLPIVVTNCRGNRDLVVDNKNGYVVKIDDVNKMEEKITSIIKNKKLRCIMAKESKKMSKKYLLEEVLNEVEKIYDSK